MLFDRPSFGENRAKLLANNGEFHLENKKNKLNVMPTLGY